MTSGQPTWANFDSRVADAIQTQFLRISAPSAAALLWERTLTSTERKKLGGDLQSCYARLGTVGMWMKLRGVSKVRAILDVAHELHLLSDGDYRWLLRETGELPTAAPQDRPTWDRVKGELRFGRQSLRRVRVMAQPSNIQQILDAFQAANWTTYVSNPLPPGQELLHQALRSLNKGLKKIRFHSQEGAGVVTWSFV